jgi:hypothetical protein
LSKLFHSKEFGEIQIERFAHLVALGIVRRTEDGIGLANGMLRLLSETGNGAPSDCQAIAAVDCQSLETSDRKKQIVSFITNHDQVPHSATPCTGRCTIFRLSRQVLPMAVAPRTKRL